jgi:hypothetical protein
MRSTRRGDPSAACGEAMRSTRRVRLQLQGRARSFDMLPAVEIGCGGCSFDRPANRVYIYLLSV